jgi:V/A-type H+-transporting ATPase subunit I
MTLRPHPARWFEVLTDREHLGDVLRCLGASGAVELESRSAVDAATALPDYRDVLDGYAALARRYAPHWPAPAPDPATPLHESLAGARDALRELRAWAAEADPLVVRVETLANERASIAELATVLADAGERFPSASALGSAGPTLDARLYAIEPGAVVDAPAAVLTLPIDVESRGAPARRYLLAVGGRSDLAELDRSLLAARARVLAWPAGLPVTRDDAARELESRLARLDADIARSRAELLALAARHRLAGRLAGFRFLDWLVQHVPRLPATEHFAYVTGWTDDADRLARALQACDVPNLLHFPAPPATLQPPTVLRNVRWVQPFEPFVRMLGTPGAGEADPTPIVAALAPLLFGFMFGDVGQGVLLAIAGLVLRRRWPAVRLLVWGGVAAIAFGFAFGSVFAREDLVPALWVRPLDAPLVVLVASVAFGVVVIATGFAVDALQHAWRGEGRRWLLRRGGLVLAYAGAAFAVVDASALVLVAIGVLGVAAGAAYAERDVRAAGAALGEFAETALQLVVNTVSFARVGAFALAHAGLSAAVVGLASAAGDGIGGLAALALGNALIVALEGLVVGIQTTRLVLFEFFIRFLRADGRAFRPLPDPDVPAPRRPVEE